MSPGAQDVLRAAARLEGVVHRTPVMTSRTLDRRLGAEVFLKAENFQRGGSFKLRGAYNKISTADTAELARGVVASSSGNHAQAVAIAARLHGVPATIVMPQDAVPVKVEATRAYGAEVLFIDRYRSDLERCGEQEARARDCLLIHPFDDEAVIAGQGTAALELLADVPDLDFVVAPVGGGGLVAGTALITKARSARTQVIGVEPTTGDDTHRSLRAGRRVVVPPPASIADGQLLRQPGRLPFEIIRRQVDDICLVSDAQIVDAMRFLLERLKLLVEPSGATGVAALLAAPGRFRGHRVGVIVSGGNISMDRLCELLGARTRPALEPVA